ncbi:auxin response factor 4-like isoform X2 [Camellia sinensis]|uniref:auxin response factor 4-like isoform X2 n=1 Tax=Camellia sinensis TaxID=4442 RepID=UPI0010367454|nr:auxin response factor 4-like isoform X2 [Camellia sinensis]XP_028080989.1 auxin response factor 4-like isoform X2 [Camellia sinensis]
MQPDCGLVEEETHKIECQFSSQPWRHLLTTGWSIFVSQKNLVSGDAVLLLRDEGGEMRFGIRRAVQPRNGLPDLVLGNQIYRSVLSPVGNVVSTKSTFHVFYYPRLFLTLASTLFHYKQRMQVVFHFFYCWDICYYFGNSRS